MFPSEPLQRKYVRVPSLFAIQHAGTWVLYYVLWLVSYHIDVEVAQKGTQLLPEDGIALPKHGGAIVKKEN
jgi:hypothetical protein